LLEARRVSKVFGAVTALDEVTLTVDPGEWVAITGASGSGKTTLLQLFAALEAPTKGQIVCRGQDLAGLRDLNHYRRKTVGIVFQLHNLLPHLDVRGNVEIVMYGTHHGRHQRVEKVNELLDSLDLIAQQDRKPPELSGGERQRVAIARALANDPEALLADEPTGSLDSDHVERLLQILESLDRERHMAIVMVTHDIEVAGRADRVLRLDAGHMARSRRVPTRQRPEKSNQRTESARDALQTIEARQTVGSEGSP
jgi:putative ABC transport system ATP-binding protein